MAFNIINGGFLCTAIILAGCAEKSQNIQPTYVSPIQYQSYSCSQIGEESRRVASRASQVAGTQDKNSETDAAITAAALILFWPAAFFIGGNKENRAQLGKLKGELEALEQASIKRNCGITFRK